MMAHSRPGFSLVELSIVLVILGLLVGGVLGGQSLIKAAELRNISTEIGKFETATNAFLSKYSNLPGDMPNAGDYWGLANPDPNTCKATASTGTETCNGDSSGTVITDGNNDSYNESLRYWQHLANAGLIEGRYTGKSQSGDYTRYDAQPGVNVPASKVSGGGYSIWNRGTLSGEAAYFDGTYRQFIIFGREYGTASMSAPIISTADAYGIDTKFDDGKPGSGKVMSWKSTSPQAPGCATNDDPATAQYAVTSDAILCSLIFKIRQ